MTIRRRIIYGYGLALGVAIVGAATGFVVGNYYTHQALEARQAASNQRKFLSTLQLDILRNRPAKQLSPYVQDPEGFRQEGAKIIANLEAIQSELTAYNNSTHSNSLEGLQPLLNEYEQTVNACTQMLRDFIEKIQPLTTTTAGSEEAEKLVVQVVRAPEFVAFIEFPDQLADFYKQAEQREDAAEVALAQAEALRSRIIVAGLGLSVAIAIFLALYISRAIARPIQSVTDVAQQVTRESNFDLQAPIYNQDEVGVLATSLNQLIDRVKQLLQEKQDYTAQLELAKEVADTANQAKSEFLANMSHELRTPLNGILGYTQILSRTMLAEQQQRGIDIIHQCGSHLLTLINDVLDLAKIEARHMEMYPTPCYLPAILQGVAEISRIKAEQKGLHFVYQAPDDLPTGVIVDEKRLRQVLLNLLGNAVKFTHRGTVTLKLDAQPIQPNAIADTESDVDTETMPTVKLRFQIEDTGVGMGSNQLEAIFLPFEQVGSVRHQQQGTGLGLAISQSIVAMMGSQIQVRSELGVGSVFEFEIECPLSRDWAYANTLTPLGKLGGYLGKRRQILVVDDRWENRSVLRSLLEPLDFTVQEASNGQEALQIVNQSPPDLIITDLKMPGVDGWQLMTELRQTEATKDMIVIVSSASVFDADRHKSFMAGGNDFLPKPVQAEELYHTLAQHLHLDWIYTESNLPSSPSAGQTSMTEMVLPNSAELQQLLDYAMRGHLSGLSKELDQMLQSNGQYHVFVEKLNTLAKGFKIVQIRQFLQDALYQQV